MKYNTQDLLADIARIQNVNARSTTVITDDELTRAIIDAESINDIKMILHMMIQRLK